MTEPKIVRKIGRPKGALNKATADIKAIAQPYAPEAIETLRKIMRTSQTDAARVAAARELLDRGFGRAPQTVNATVEQRMVARMPEPARDADEWLQQSQVQH